MAENKVALVGISGGSGSGKTTIVNKIAEIIPDLVVIAQDNYYKDAGDASLKGPMNFDHPSAFDTQCFMEHLSTLAAGHTVDVPHYDFVHHRRKTSTTKVVPGPLVVIEGILLYYDPGVRDLFDLKIFVDTPDDIRFIRRLIRDQNERGRTADSVINQYLTSVRPGHYEFIEPTKAYADLIIPEGGNNDKALEVLTSFIRGQVAPL